MEPVNSNLKLLSPINTLFETSYIEVRKKEKRLYSEEEIKNLPYVAQTNPYYKEWALRIKSYNRFKNYLKKKKNIKLLEIGCGNGWFCSRLADIESTNIIFGLDINLFELEQASRLFKKNNLSFFYGDIFETIFTESRFDIIVLNSTVQYFEDLDKLINRLFSLLNKKGEIHFIDSPFYKEHEIEDAKKRTLSYYTKLGYPEMSSQYYHHDKGKLDKFSKDILYNPHTLKNKFKKILSPDTPFPWIRIKKENY